MKMLDWAIQYHNEGICVIPCKPRDKAPLIDWAEYQTRMSTEAEIRAWWTETPTANIGCSHGVNGFLCLDFDHDRGIFDQMRARFPWLFVGRLEQSGSGEGYHLPAFVAQLPDFGYDNGKDRPKGNRTYRTPAGDVNIRARYCQTVTAPSVHPSGGLYRFLQDAPIVRVDNLAPVIAWMGTLDPAQRTVTPKAHRPTSPAQAGGTCDEIKRYLPDVAAIFGEFGITGRTEREPNGDIRIHDNGGLLVTEDGRWYSFRDEMGGDQLDAWGYGRFWTAWDRHNRVQFAQVVKEIKERYGIGETRRPAPAPKETRNFNYWGAKLTTDYWAR